MSRAFVLTLSVLPWLGLLAGCGGGDSLVLPDEGLPRQLVVIRGTGQTAAAGAVLPDSIVVRVTDSKDRPVVGQQVEFTVAGGGSVTADTATTNADGRAGVRWTLGAAAGVQTLTARVIGSNVPSPLSTAVTATAGAGGAAGAAIVRGENQTATAGSLLPDSLVVRVTDANGNPVPGVAVTWSVAGGGSVSAATTATGPDGRTGVLRTLGASAGAQTTTATAAVPGSPIVFHATATVGAAGRLTISTQPSATAQSGTPFAQQPRLQLRDANGNPVSQAGLAVTASISQGPAGASLIGAATTATDANGVAAFSGLGLSGPGGAYILNFGGAGLSGVSSGTITIGAGSASQLSLTTQPSSTAASGAAFAQQPVVQLLDANSNVAAQAGVQVSVALASGGGTLLGTTTRTTDAAGRATFTDLAISGATGPRTLLFFSGSLTTTTSNTISITAASVSGSQSTLSAAPGSFAAGTGSSTITVVAKDASGNRVSGASVVLAVSGTGNTVSAPALTDANGTTTATLTSTVAGSKVISATINGTAVTQTATVTVTAGPPSGATSTVAAAPPSVPVNTPSTITVTALDANGNPVSGVTVTLAASGGTGNVLVQPLPTGADGKTTGTFTSGSAGTKTITATLNGTVLVTQQATVTVTPPPVSAGLSTVTAAPASITASTGSSASTVTVTVRDALGSPVAGATVTLVSSGSNNVITPATGTTSASGVATFTFSSGMAELKTLTATANGVVISQTAQVTVTAGAAAAAQSTATVPNGTRNLVTTFTVQLRDAFGNKLSTGSGTVTSTVTGKNAGKVVTITNNNDGTYTGTYTPTATGVDFVNIFLNGTAIGGSPYTSNVN